MKKTAEERRAESALKKSIADDNKHRRNITKRLEAVRKEIDALVRDANTSTFSPEYLLIEASALIRKCALRFK